ncbi:hypothetical protein [Thalassospira mesophila]|uniref:Uncharacterized protein n=1 Tax=Thalassospira mesophila TaxID=1293891 RepID=A0A1Y2KXD3_9PROT|nr:hypothetical protein [Thalassospira mesophila]OSQ37030.1 hypothetical protein TMES_16445 [Thalassospira mesophila]
MNNPAQTPLSPTSNTAATSTDIAGSLPDILSRLDTLLDVEWRILEQAQYDLLPDITTEKVALQNSLQAAMQAEFARISVKGPLACFNDSYFMVSDLKKKLDRNNTRLLARRDACLKRIRAGWLAVRPDSATRYDRDGDLASDFSHVLLNLKL